MLAPLISELVHPPGMIWDQNASQIWHWEFQRLPLFPETWMEAVGSDCHVVYPYICLRGGCYSMERLFLYAAICLRGLCVCPWLWLERMECVRCDRLHATFPHSWGVGMKTQRLWRGNRCFGSLTISHRYPKIGKNTSNCITDDVIVHPSAHLYQQFSLVMMSPSVRCVLLCLRKGQSNCKYNKFLRSAHHVCRSASIWG